MLQHFFIFTELFRICSDYLKLVVIHSHVQPVGNPLILYFSPKAFSLVASTAARVPSTCVVKVRRTHQLTGNELDPRPLPYLPALILLQDNKFPIKHYFQVVRKKRELEISHSEGII